MPPHDAGTSPVQMHSPVRVPEVVHETSSFQGVSRFLVPDVVHDTCSLQVGFSPQGESSGKFVGRRHSSVQGGCSPQGGSSGHFVGRRRIFVQVDNGSVLGVELDRADKADAVKKRVQAALRVPTEQSALVFGDHILENDLSEVRQDSPVLLTRNLCRSSSTPCISPIITDGVQKLKEALNQPIEIVGGRRCSPTLTRLIRETSKAIENGIHPRPATGGLGGAYYFRNRKGECAAIVKPTDEEPFAPNNPNGFVGKALGQPGMTRSIRVGETGVREVAAYLLDHHNFANVPATALVKAAHPIFNVNTKDSITQREGTIAVESMSKLCSYQQYVKHDFDASEHGTSRFPVSQVHRIGILDVRILNTDRHSGNILVRKLQSGESTQLTDAATWKRSLGEESVVLTPIDHGLSLPEQLEDPYFGWLHWPQASMPFSEEELRYISSLDPYRDADMLRVELPMLRESCIRVLIICTIFLQMGAEAGLTLAEIGGMMSREICGMDEEPSELESICMLCKLEQEKGSWSEAGIDALSCSDEDFSGEKDQFQLDLDRDGEDWNSMDNEHSFSRGRTLRSPTHVVGFSFDAPKECLVKPTIKCDGRRTNSYPAGCPPPSPRFVAESVTGLPSLLTPQEMHTLEKKKVGNLTRLLSLSSPKEIHTLEERVAYPGSYKLAPMRRSSPPFEVNEKKLTSPGSFNSDSYSRWMGAPRSVDRSKQKFSCRDEYKPRILARIRGAASAFEMARKVNKAGGDMSTPIEFSHMTETEWYEFLNCFDHHLPSAFARRKAESTKVPKLGTSCRF